MNYSDEFFMSRCIELARLGMGRVAPNPMVGAVIVYKQKIIGEGFHEKYGKAHAEVNAINSVADKDLLKKSTIYVNLEPCSHYGKTPPCADLIVHYKFKRVVIGMKDPFAKVNGLGIKKIQQAGIEVVTGVLQQKCKELNKIFITYHTQHRPYIVLKWAETNDGYIDIIRNKQSEQKPNWITNETCRALVHKYRAELEAILVGTDTAVADNPKLNVRLWSGKSPVRVVIDNSLRLPKSLYVFDNSIKTLIFNSLENKIQENTEYVKIDFSKNVLRQILDELYKKQINSLLVEGGQKTLQSFIDSELYDEVLAFVGNKNFKNGINAPTIKKHNFKTMEIGNSKLIYGD